MSEVWGLWMLWCRASEGGLAEWLLPLVYARHVAQVQVPHRHINRHTQATLHTVDDITHRKPSLARPCLLFDSLMCDCVVGGVGAVPVV
jgi:hypothetical protein